LKVERALAVALLVQLLASVVHMSDDRVARDISLRPLHDRLG
jgi:hypothetical protein